jgi:hypothetical protein
MDLVFILSNYFIFVIILTITLYLCGENFNISLFISIIIGFLFLVLCKSPNNIEIENEDISYVFIYYSLIVISFISILFYSLFSSIGSLKCVNNKRFCNLSC